MKRIAVYAGSFDPPTLGHLWMMREGAALFDELIVVLAVNPDKRGFLPMDERARLLRGMLADIGAPGALRLAVHERGFLAEFAREQGAQYLLRGVRNARDLDYEKTIARMNARMEPGLHTLFLSPPAELEDISSTLVRGFVGQPGWERWAAACVPPAVLEAIRRQQG